MPLHEAHLITATRLGCLFSDAVVATTSVMRDLLVGYGVAPEKIFIIPCGVPPPARLPARAEARARLGLPEDAFVVSTLSRLVAYKGVHQVIEAVAQLADLWHPVRLIVTGDGPLRSPLERLAEERLPGRALFLGHVADTADTYAAADLFIMASDSEGFGLVFIEAAFHGVPSIGADVGGVRYAIADGQTGFLVPPQDPPALASAIRRLQTDPGLRRQMGDTARVRAYGTFTAWEMAARYARVLYPE